MGDLELGFPIMNGDVCYLIPDATRTQLFALYQPNTFLGSRNLAILAVLSDTGLRREEAANLQLKNVDVHAQTLKVYSDKTEEWRYLPLTDEATTLIKSHLTWRERYFTQSGRHRTKVGDDAHRRRRERKIESDHLFLTGRSTAQSRGAGGGVHSREPKARLPDPSAPFPT